MFKLHPIPDVSHTCPYCDRKMDVKGWHIPGMRNLADLECTNCGRGFYGDLLAGQALFTPLLVEKNTGAVHDKYNVGWFAGWLRDPYARRTPSPIGFKAEEFKPIKNAILLNCLDTLYGHSLLKLLNAQYYLDNCPGLDLIVMVQPMFRWLVPDGVAAVWTVDLPLKNGTEWNERLAGEIKRRIGPLDSCWLSVAHSHPHPSDYSIERFTRVRPFSADDWSKTPDRPVVTFIWRDDRPWCGKRMDSLLHSLKKIGRRAGIFQKMGAGQKSRVITLARILRDAFPDIDFVVAGLGKPGGLPAWITDMRALQIDVETERRWCELYARSHVVIGVHGSNMLLPSAHSGAVIELIPHDRWGNMLQDILFRDMDGRETLFLDRVIPCSTSPEEVAGSAISLIKDHDIAMLQMGRAHCRHDLECARNVHLRWKLIK